MRYSTDSGSNYTTLTTTSVAAGQTDNSSLSVPAQSHGTEVIIKYSVENARLQHRLQNFLASKVVLQKLSFS